MDPEMKKQLDENLPEHRPQRIHRRTLIPRGENILYATQRARQYARDLARAEGIVLGKDICNKDGFSEKQAAKIEQIWDQRLGSQR